MLTGRHVVAISCTAIAAVLGLVALHEHRVSVEKKEAAAAHERQREVERAQRRRACGLADGAVLHEVESVEGECQRVLLGEWKWPGTAAFPGFFDDDGPLESPDGCLSTYRSWMDAPDGKGENLRQNYSCTYDPRTGVATITLL